MIDLPSFVRVGSLKYPNDADPKCYVNVLIMSGEYLFSAHANGFICCWDISRRSLERTFCYGIDIHQMVVVGDILYAWAPNHVLKGWNITTGKCVFISENLTAYTQLFSFNGMLLVMIDIDLYKLEDNRLKFYKQLSHQSCVYIVDNNLYFLDFRNEIMENENGKQFPIYGPFYVRIPITSAGNFVFTAKYDFIVQYDKNTSEVVHEYNSKGVADLLCHDNFLFVSKFNGNIDQWNIVTKKLSQTFIGHIKSAYLLIWNGFLYSQSYDYTIKCWNIETCKCITTYKIKSPVVDMNFAGDSFYVVDGEEILIFDIAPYSSPKLALPRLSKEHQMAAIFIVSLLVGVGANKNVVGEILRQVSFGEEIAKSKQQVSFGDEIVKSKRRFPWPAMIMIAIIPIAYYAFKN